MSCLPLSSVKVLFTCLISTTKCCHVSCLSMSARHLQKAYTVVLSCHVPVPVSTGRRGRKVRGREGREGEREGGREKGVVERERKQKARQAGGRREGWGREGEGWGGQVPCLSTPGRSAMLLSHAFRPLQCHDVHPPVSLSPGEERQTTSHQTSPSCPPKSPLLCLNASEKVLCVQRVSQLERQRQQAGRQRQEGVVVFVCLFTPGCHGSSVCVCSTGV